MRRAAILLLSLCFAGPALADDWAQLGGDGAKTGTTGEQQSPATTQAWSVAIGSKLVAGPIVMDGVVVVLAADGTVRGYDATNGSLVWTTALGGEFLAGTPAGGQGTVIVALGDGTLQGLSVENGSVQWTEANKAAPLASPAVEGGWAFVSLGFPSHGVQARALKTNATHWGAHIPQISYSSPASNGALVVFGANDGSYRAHDRTTGAPVWSYVTAGRVLLAGPSIVGNAVYVIPGGQDRQIHSVHTDMAQWGAANWTLNIDDPDAPPVATSILGMQMANCTPASNGTRLVATVRYDYTVKRAGLVEFVSRERVFGVDVTAPPAAPLWSVALGSIDVPNQQQVPRYALSPSPIILSDAGGDHAIITCSLDATVRFLNIDTGAETTSFTVPGERWADAGSPAVANGQLFMVTDQGTLLAIRLGGNQAPDPPVVTTPNGAEFTTLPATLTWSASDPEDPAATLSHEVRVDEDGEVLIDSLVSAAVVPGITSLDLTTLPSDVPLTVRIRSQDPNGAYSPWSVAGTFSLALPPLPPSGLAAAPGIDDVVLTWTASPSTYVASYLVAYRELPSGSFTPLQDVGDVTTTTVGGLTPGTTYEFQLVARSTKGYDSAPPLTAQSTPNYPISIGGTSFQTLADAFAAAGPGDTIQLGEGTFTVNGPQALSDGVTLRGVNAHVTRIFSDDPLQHVFTVPTGQSARAELLAVSVGQTAFLVGDSASLELENVLLYELREGIASTSNSSVSVFFCTLVDMTETALKVGGGSLDLSNSVVTKNAVGVDCAAGAIVETLYNAVGGNSSEDWVGCLSDPTDTAAVAVFLDPALDDYRVSPFSPTVNTADPDEDVGLEPTPNGDRPNQGAFGTTLLAATTAPPVLDKNSFSLFGCSLGLGQAPGSGAAWLGLVLLGLLTWRRRQWLA